MAILTWDQTGEKRYKTGVSHGVLFKRGASGSYDDGVAWSGLTACNLSPEGAEATALYADNQKYLDLISQETLKYTIEAYTYPDEWAECDGSKEIAPGVYATQQTRSHFGFSYQNKLGNDTLGTDYGYEIHLIYDSTAAPSENSNSTENDSPEAATLSWSCSTTPVSCKACKPTSHLVINSTKCDAEALARLEGILYGSESTAPRLPLPDEVLEILNASSI